MTSRYQLREANAGDVPRLAELLIRMDAHVAGTPRRVLKPTTEGMRDIETRIARLIDNPHARVAVVVSPSDKVVAMGDLQVWHYPDLWENPERRGRVVGVIDDIWVEPRHRRRGLNRRLVADLVDFARERGVQELHLEYSLSNQEAAAAWSRLGFEPTGVRASASPETVQARLAENPNPNDEESSA